MYKNINPNDEKMKTKYCTLRDSGIIITIIMINSTIIDNTSEHFVNKDITTEYRKYKHGLTCLREFGSNLKRNI